jgi:SET domain-containing protein
MYRNFSMTQAASEKNSRNADAGLATDKADTPRKAGRRIQVRRSGVHGKGVFAILPIASGQRVIEYRGEVITWREALRRHPHDPKDPNHTFYFHIDDKHVIDAKVDGNKARWINHACTPNCEADEVDGRVFIKALVDIQPGEELFYDYGLVIDERYTKKLKKQFECRCGSPHCRGTMLAPKR